MAMLGTTSHQRPASRNAADVPVVVLRAAFGNVAIQTTSFAEIYQEACEFLAAGQRGSTVGGSSCWLLYEYRDIEIAVLSQTTFATFLNLAVGGFLGAQQQAMPSLVVSEETGRLGKGVVRPPVVAATAAPAQPSSAATGPGRMKAARASGVTSSSSGTSFTADADTDPPAAGAGVPTTTRTGVAAPSPLSVGSLHPSWPVVEMPNHVRAQQLLASFLPPSAPLEPVVRTVMYNGCFSKEVRFDPFNPPNMEELRQRLWADFEPYLRDRATELGAPDPEIDTFVVAFNVLGGSDVAVDMDTTSDVRLAAQVARDRGEDNVFFYVDIAPFTPEDTEVDVITETVLVSPPRGLGINQVHTPRRDKKKAA